MLFLTSVSTFEQNHGIHDQLSLWNFGHMTKYKVDISFIFIDRKKEYISVWFIIAEKSKYSHHLPIGN